MLLEKGEQLKELREALSDLELLAQLMGKPYSKKETDMEYGKIVFKYQFHNGRGKNRKDGSLIDVNIGVKVHDIFTDRPTRLEFKFIEVFYWVDKDGAVNFETDEIHGSYVPPQHRRESEDIEEAVKILREVAVNL